MKYYRVVAHEIAKETPKQFWVIDQVYSWGDVRYNKYHKRDDGTPYIDDFIGFDLTKEQILEIVENRIKKVQESLYESVERLDL